MIKPKVVVFDIDDVLIPWAATVHQECIKQGIAPSDSTWTKWEMWEDWPGTEKSQWTRVVDSLVVPNSLYHQPPYPGAREALVKLHNSGSKISFVTARGFFAHAEEIRAWTMEWVEKYFGDLLYTKRDLWFAQDKGDVANIIGATHAIDDRFDNVLGLQRAGVDAYLMNQPHNKSVTVMPDDHRVDNVGEFVERILSA